MLVHGRAPPWGADSQRSGLWKPPPHQRPGGPMLRPPPQALLLPQRPTEGPCPQVGWPRAARRPAGPWDTRREGCRASPCAAIVGATSGSPWGPSREAPEVARHHREGTCLPRKGVTHACSVPVVRSGLGLTRVTMRRSCPSTCVDPELERPAPRKPLPSPGPRLPPLLGP